MRVAVELPERPAHVLADATEIHQILLNLAVNARDALPDGGRIVLGVAEALRDGAPVVALSVADDGTGMDAATLGRIFTPFFTTKPVGQGTGLGLSIVKGAVEQAGGSIAVESAPGAGTRFRIELPHVGAPGAGGDAGAAPPAPGSCWWRTTLRCAT